MAIGMPRAGAHLDAAERAVTVQAQQMVKLLGDRADAKYQAHAKALQEALDGLRAVLAETREALAAVGQQGPDVAAAVSEAMAQTNRLIAAQAQADREVLAHGLAAMRPVPGEPAPCVPWIFTIKRDQLGRALTIDARPA